MQYVRLSTLVVEMKMEKSFPAPHIIATLKKNSKR